MAKINTPEELRLMREKLRADLEIRENSNTPDELPQIRVSMDECGIAAGAKAVLATFVEELAARRIRGIVTQTGCAGHCKDEPTVEITLPGRRPVLYGHVTAERVAELVERQIVRGETAEGLIEAEHAAGNPRIFGKRRQVRPSSRASETKENDPNL